MGRRKGAGEKAIQADVENGRGREREGGRERGRREREGGKRENEGEREGREREKERRVGRRKRAGERDIQADVENGKGREICGNAVNHDKESDRDKDRDRQRARQRRRQRIGDNSRERK